MKHAHPFQPFWNEIHELGNIGNGMVLRVSDNNIPRPKETDDDLPPEKVTGIALYSMCLNYRYALSWVWDKTKPIFTAVMLNPSTATEFALDPTVQRVFQRARADGRFGSFLVLNIFAYRATDPDALRAQKDPVGRENDRVIDALLPFSEVVLCGWGTHGVFLDRGRYVEARIRRSGMTPMVLKLTKDGHPNHPLYVGYGVRLKAWEAVSAD